MMTTSLSDQPEWYRRWRAKFLWTDEEFARVFEEQLEHATNDYRRAQLLRGADACRAGRISRAMIRFTLPFLIKDCCVCKRPALYRNGVLGFCGQHKADAAQARYRNTAWLDARYVEMSTQMEGHLAARDRAERHHTACGRKRRGYK